MKRGFTLIELLVVIAIIGMLATVILASLSAARSRGYDAQRVSNMRQVQKALEAYAIDHDGKYPIKAGGNWNGTCNAWVVLPRDSAIPNLVSEGYMSQLPYDPEVNQTGSKCCYLYNSSSDGSYYKYLMYDCPTSKACYGTGRNMSLSDPIRNNACAVYSPGAESL